MKITLHNISRKPVSFLCNSGKAYHLPPHLKTELPMFEVSENAFIEKLLSRRLIKISSPEKPVKVPHNKSVSKNRPSKEKAKVDLQNSSVEEKN